MIRLVLADRQPLYLKGLRHLFQEEPGFEILAECSKWQEIIPAVTKHRPDILLIDIRIDDHDGFAVIRALNDLNSPPAVVILTGSLREDDVFAAVRHAVRGVVLKTMQPELLLQCLRKVHAGGQWLEKESMGRALESLLKREATQQVGRELLTNRELEVVQMASSGLTNKKIAAELFISEGTVKMHLHSIYEKLHLTGRVQLMVYARENRLISDDRRRKAGELANV